ncbi:MAG: ChrR family anti-sigma-E factor [Nitratireductor sp.]|nr:ChrR family anti-sigma-E factor [Nitratireductor sp.]
MNNNTISAKSAETRDILLAHYSAGALPRPVHAMIGAHLEMRPDSRAIVAGMEAVAGDALASFEPAALTNHKNMLDRVLQSAPGEGARLDSLRASSDVMPRALQDFTGFRADTIPWRSKLPGFKEVVLGEIDGCDARLFWIRPGRAIPEHTHSGSELTLVLDGGFFDEEGHYVRGDIAAADETVDHRPVADDDAPCICFAITTAPLRLTGSFRQLFSDVFGR